MAKLIDVDVMGLHMSLPEKLAAGWPAWSMHEGELIECSFCGCLDGPVHICHS